MFVTKLLLRASRTMCRSSQLLSASQSEKTKHLPILVSQFHYLANESSNKLHHSFFLQKFKISTSASPEATEKENGNTVPSNGDSTITAEPRSKIDDQIKNSDFEKDEDLSMDDLVKLVAEKEELLKLKHKEIEQMQDKVVRTYAEMENVMARTRREAENSKKFAVQNFAKSLLDVADNLGRSSSFARENISNIDPSFGSDGAVLLKTLLEGVEMTEKQLSEVLKKFGVEKFDPINEPFDPHRHNAAFQVSDGFKPPGTVAVVVKRGYMLYDRVLRPAEVGVTQVMENEHDQAVSKDAAAKDNETDKGSQA